MRDMLLVVVGLCGIYAEFIWPCKVIPGAAGGVLFMLGLAGMMKGPVDVHAVVLLGTPLVIVTVVLLAIAWRGLRNKTTA